jgi:diacylglycerol O-acyltransferase/trehalose O-mycolyltransferase
VLTVAYRLPQLDNHPVVSDSTRQFADAAHAAGVPVTYVARPEGSHTWGLFESEIQESWNTTIGRALGV